ncbi:DUF2637 domain-containing protein [Streptomyces sp. NPDC006208]|uniref:DUF2637 domain-containing protein n=1 Tax=Streptomyces sp. NPDC006208 TaxID=3156734 RepID=UPI0033B8BFF5
MYDEYGYGSAAAHPDVIGRAGWPDPYLTSNEVSLGGYQAMTPLTPEILDEPWDPAVELEQMLQTNAWQEFGTVPPAPDGDPLARPNEITTELPFARLSSRGHRRRAPARKSRFTLVQTASFCLATLGAVVVSMVSVFGGMVALDPLRHIAAPRMAEGLAGWWPLLVYGPWLVASLSILRASLHQRRVVHSWSVVLFFSTLTTVLCVAHAPRTLTDAAAAALPPLAALACFQQLVRQITLTRPPRQAAARHRTAASSSARPSSHEQGSNSSHEQGTKGTWTHSSMFPFGSAARGEQGPVGNAFPRQ